MRLVEVVRRRAASCFLLKSKQYIISCTAFIPRLEPFCSHFHAPAFFDAAPSMIHARSGVPQSGILTHLSPGDDPRAVWSPPEHCARAGCSTFSPSFPHPPTSYPAPSHVIPAKAGIWAGERRSCVRSTLPRHSPICARTGHVIPALTHVISCTLPRHFPPSTSSSYPAPSSVIPAKAGI